MKFSIDANSRGSSERPDDGSQGLMLQKLRVGARGYN